MDDLQSIVGDDGRLRPGRTRDDAAVELDGDAVGLEMERLKDAGQIGGVFVLWQGAGLTVELNV